MPAKKRISKAHVLESEWIEDLFYGPGTCLINGLGYLGSRHVQLWSEADKATQAAVLAEMKADWARGHRKVMAAWGERSDHELDIAKRFHGDPAQPWAITQFGEPTA